MLAHRNLCTLWLLLLLHVTASAMKFNLFKRNPEPQEGNVRLFGSESDSEGRVEVYHDGKWGTVCDDGWGIAEAQVVCRQLHFPGAKSVVIGKDYGEATGPIWLDDMKCKGNENLLSACEFKNWGVTDCSHKEDVAVICETADVNATLLDSAYSLDHSSTLSDELGQIFDNGKGCDFLIIVQSATGNRQEDGTPQMVETTFCTHKMVLSPFPNFNASEGNTNITVSVSQFCLPHFTSFIRYIYTHKMDVTFSSAQCLHWMASKFGVKRLMADTGRLFIKILPEDALFHTQVSLYKYAEETGDLVLQENCIQYLAWNYQNLTRSPAWSGLSVELLGALLYRSDLVVPNEYFLLQTVESWLVEKGNSTSLDTQAQLLSRIRFPMIPAEKLYELESNSSLYSTHMNLYRENIMKALQFNVLLFSNLASNPKFNKETDDYLPRIYTAKPWSTDIDPSKEVHSHSAQTRHNYNYNRNFNYNYNYNYNRNYGTHDYLYTTVSPHTQTITESFSAPVHNSLIFKDNKIHWEVNVIRKQAQCPSSKCESLPVVKLASQNHSNKPGNVVFRNQLLLICQGKYICQVHDFKDNLAHVTVNGTHTVAYPCRGDEYTYRIVVRPEYV
uniref:galectin-3-binding protein B-like n=1 Tax=Scatophagus argus TaxID=75038 RepID=UPI001ED7E00C|nr:galectin-3-binding protein B-like [Scatophagus argus]